MVIKKPLSTARAQPAGQYPEGIEAEGHLLSVADHQESVINTDEGDGISYQ